MGLFDFLFGDGNSDGKNYDSDSKTRVSEDGDSVHVRNTSVIYDADSNSKNHDTAWSNTHYNTNTGEWSHNEGAHGPNYKDSIGK